MDHLIAQMDTYFGEIQMNVSKLLCLVPEVLASWSDAIIDAAIHFYRDDLVSPYVVDVTNGQKWLKNWVFQIMPQPHLENATLFLSQHKCPTLHSLHITCYFRGVWKVI